MREGLCVNVPTWLWIASVGLLIGLLAVDVFVIIMGKSVSCGSASSRSCSSAASWPWLIRGIVIALGAGRWSCRA